MKIEQLEIEKLKPYEKNAKLHPQEQIDKLATMIAKVGMIQPVVIGKDNTIIIGHGRTEAAKQAGLTTVPVVKLDDLTEAEERSLRLFDNKIQDTGFDIDILNQELFELSELPEFDITLTGFELPKFEPDLPDDEDKPQSSVDYVLRIVCEDEDQQQELFDELKERGFKVKV